MSRPENISEQDIKRWDETLKDDKIMSKMKYSDVFKEVLYANLYLREQLETLDCPEDLIVRINYTAGKMSFGRDPWDVSEYLLEQYKGNELVLESDPNAETN